MFSQKKPFEEKENSQEIVAEACKIITNFFDKAQRQTNIESMIIANLVVAVIAAIHYFQFPEEQPFPWNNYLLGSAAASVMGYLAAPPVAYSNDEGHFRGLGWLSKAESDIVAKACKIAGCETDLLESILNHLESYVRAGRTPKKGQ